jgi:hypothetical protein
MDDLSEDLIEEDFNLDEINVDSDDDNQNKENKEIKENKENNDNKENNEFNLLDNDSEKEKEKEKKNKESENINYVEDGDCILITNGNYNLECIISKNYYENPDEEKKDIILNCDNIFIEDLQITKNSYLLCDYSNKIEKTKYYEITRGSGRYNETEFIIKIY